MDLVNADVNIDVKYDDSRQFILRQYYFNKNLDAMKLHARNNV